MIFGFLYSLACGIRWFLIYPDFDKAVTGIILGVVIIGVSWIYGELRKLNLETMALGDFLADFTRK